VWRVSVPLGLGIGWRPELALAIDRREDLGFIEILAEHVDPTRPLPVPLRRLSERGVAIAVHSTGLSLGGAEPIDGRRLDRLARVAEWAGAVCLSDHVSFARAGGHDSRHLLPLPRTEEALAVLCANVARVRRALPVPFAVENIAPLFAWPDPTMDEPALLRRLLDETGALLLLDVSNLYAAARNVGVDPHAWLGRAPLDRLAYVHVAGGVARGQLWHDTHAHPIPAEALALVRALPAPPGIMLERDDRFPSAPELYRELDALQASAWSRLPDAPAPRRMRTIDPGDADQLAGRQAALVAALVAGAPAPDGFDGARLQIEAEVLAARHRRCAGSAARLPPGGGVFSEQAHRQGS
jgi:uncharacterized protein (UPF0276 family)